MNKRIYKYPVPLQDTTIINTCVGAKVLTIGPDPSGEICVWMEVDLDVKSIADLRINTRGTGHPVPSGRYITSLTDGPFVWHYYAED